MGSGGKTLKILVVLFFLALQMTSSIVRGQAQAKPCHAALQKAQNRRKAGYADVSSPTCDANGFYKLGYYCGAFFCVCVVDKYGKKDSTISRNNCIKQIQNINVKCVNKNGRCDAWARQGYCHTSSQYRAFMMNNCKKACCVNNHKLCSYWASVGECAKNRVYMYTNCKAACHACTC